MKILVITDGFFPGKNYGGPPVSVDNFCSLMEQCQCYVVTKNHDKGDQTPYDGIQQGWNDRGNCRVRYLSDREYGPGAFAAAMDELKPDWVFLQSLFQSCVLPCLWLASRRGIRVLLAPRGELCAGAFRKKYKKLPYIAVLRLLGLLRKTRFLSTSEEESQEVMRYLGAEQARVFQIPNIPSVPAFRREPHRTGNGETRLVFLSRIHPKKNLLAAIRCLEGVRGKVSLDIYGPLEDAAYWRQCQKAAQTLPATVSVNYRGVVAHEEVHRVFSEHDGFLFPTLSENYGHVIVEALSVGCPAVISDQTPWLDLESNHAGWAIPLEKEAEFTAAVQKLVDTKTTEYSEHALRYAEKKLNLAQLREQYGRILA